MGKTFCVIHNIPSPYRLHVFTALWKELKARGWDFHVHFMSDMSRGYEERPLSWRNPKMDFPHTYWRDYGRGQRHFNPGLLWWLRRHPTDVLWCGSPFDTGTGMLAARCAKAKVTCSWCEGNTKTTGVMTGFKGWIKRWVLSSYRYVAVPGRDAEKYIALHQFRTTTQLAKPLILPNLIDEARFNPRQKTSRGWRQAIIPARLKSVKGLLEFVSLLDREILKGWRIVIIGDGELREPLLRLIRERNLDENIQIKAFVAYEEMPAQYAESDLLILPSVYDPNPLSVVEALHSGLAIALTSEAGNVEEAVAPGKNGWILPVKNRERFRAVLEAVFSATPAQLKAMGDYSLAHQAQFWNTEKCIRHFVDVLTEGL